MNNLTIKNNEKYFMFAKCSDLTYLIDTNDIVEIIKMPRLEYPQRLPKYVSGLLEYQGEIISTIDLKNVLGLEVKPYNQSTMLIILEDKHNGEKFALALDSVDKVDKIDIHSIKPAPINNVSSFTRGIYLEDEKSIPILDIRKIIRTVQDGIQNNEVSDIGNILPSFDSEVYLKRSLYCKDEKKALSTLSVNNSNQYVTFRINDTDYCINNRFVKGFHKINQEKITKIPSSKDFIMGILNVKGEYISIIDLNSFFGREKGKINSKTTIIIPDSGEFKIGFMADKIGNSINIENLENSIENSQSYVLDEKIYYILNIQNILNDEKLYLK